MADSDRPRPKRLTRRAAVPRTPDAVDIALERADDDDAARALLTKHTQLLDRQIAGERLEHSLKRMQVATRILVALAAAVIVGTFTWMVLDARADHSLVIEGFAVPPDLAARGVTGEVLAGNLADRLGEIDRSANSFRSPETMSVNWGDDVKIEIPSTGVSIGELDRFLRRRLGHETVIGGSVFRTPQGLRMTVRTGALGTVEQVGKDVDLEAMTRKAAEGVFEKTQPYRYSKYLEFSGRRDEAMAVARRLVANSDDPKERAWAWAQISNLFDVSGNDAAAAVAGKRAILEDSGNALAYLNTQIALSKLSHDRDAKVYGDKADDIGSNPDGGLSDVGRNTSRGNLALRSASSGDFQHTLSALNQISGPVYFGTRELGTAQRAMMLLAMHDIRGSQLAAQSPSDTYLVAHFNHGGGLVAPQFFESIQMEDWPGALRQTQAMLATLAAAPEGKTVADLERERHVLPLYAQALALNGFVAQARAVAGTLPFDCANCANARMVVAALARDYRNALHWYAQVRIWGPDTPFAPTSLGEILERQGHHIAALRLVDEALRSGPKFPDALKLRGDALRKLNRLDEAVESYAKAAEGAPRWGRLQIDWGFAEMRRGRWDDARKHLAAAATMDLNPADRRLFDRLNQVARCR